MTKTKREIERKYETDDGALPDLTAVPGAASVVGKGVTHLDATYYDTADERLAAGGITLRRRTGGHDSGWHLKLPVAPGVRDEIHAPLSDEIPRALAALVRSRVRGSALLPVVRLRSERDAHHLVDADGTLLAEASTDTVTAERLNRAGGSTRWTEIEVELADDGDPAFLDKVEKRLRKAGARRSQSTSKLARALEETGSPRPRAAGRAEPVTAGDHVLAYVRAQRDAIVEYDPAVRRDVPDAVHKMRVATRRMRSTFRSFGTVLDRAATDPVAAELKWLAGELGADRDQEVLAERLTTALAGLPAVVTTEPARRRLAAWAGAEHRSNHAHLLAVLDSARYLALLDAVDALLADPPLLPAGTGKPRKVLAKAVRKDLAKISRLVTEALELPSGPDRDVAVHEARKKAKRGRYAAEATSPALGGPARALGKALKTLTGELGDHQDSVMARTTLRELSAVAHAAGENAFPYGVLYAREEARAAATENELPALWKKIHTGASV
ncbi:CYTH and CHAD domain-containing protein [Streptomyces ziwulingensis]|uniref:CYTH and CHAD domain-containing protein n=1 Tax=Streptomyces ziwulingensis TaxID=1045501 RepID=A0ABP9C0Y0_9ACTN